MKFLLFPVQNLFIFIFYFQLLFHARKYSHLHLPWIVKSSHVKLPREGSAGMRAYPSVHLCLFVCPCVRICMPEIQTCTYDRLFFSRRPICSRLLGTFNLYLCVCALCIWFHILFPLLFLSPFWYFCIKHLTTAITFPEYSPFLRVSAPKQRRISPSLLLTFNIAYFCNSFTTSQVTLVAEVYFSKRRRLKCMRLYFETGPLIPWRCLSMAIFCFDRRWTVFPNWSLFVP